MQRNRFSMLVIWALILGTVWVGLMGYRDIFLTADAPRAVTARGALADFERQNIDIFERISPSVAYIFTERGGGLFSDSQGRGTGSGFIWDGAGHVVTNYHVIEGADRVSVTLDSGEANPASVVGVAPDYDLAVLRLSQHQSGLQPIPIGQSSNLKVGQAVLAIGNPFGLSRTLTSGIISALNRRLPTDTGREIAGVIQTDAAINPGNSGGPLLDSAGRLIGVNTAILSGSGANAGIGLAVPVDIVNRLVPALIKDGTVARPGIGISAAPEEAAVRAGVSGVIIIQVQPGSSADRAGLIGVDPDSQRLGDVITHVNGVAVSSVADLAIELDRAGVGNRATLSVNRQGRTRQVEVVVMDIS